jgi:hypothetical protein
MASVGAREPREAGAAARAQQHAQQRYTGAVLASGLRHGRGSVVFENAFFSYVGDWERGEKHGTGRLALGDGGFYDGEFRHDEMTGRGERVHADGRRYVGEWLRGEKHGVGAQDEPDGSRYEGEWRDNRRCGAGELLLPNGDRFTGTFAAHRRTGAGVLACANGDSYDGEWLADRQHGLGTAVWANGDCYVGAWREGRRHGRGRFVDAVSGIIYDGEWQHDLPCEVPACLTARLPPAPSPAGDDAPPGEQDAQQQQQQQQQPDQPIEVAVGALWASVLRPAVLRAAAPEREDAAAGARQQLLDRVVTSESGRVVELLLVLPKGAEANARLALLRTEAGLAQFEAPQGAGWGGASLRVPDSLEPGKEYLVRAVDATPGLRDEERLEPDEFKLFLLNADGSGSRKKLGSGAPPPKQAKKK